MTLKTLYDVLLYVATTTTLPTTLPPVRLSKFTYVYSVYSVLREFIEFLYKSSGEHVVSN